MDETNQVGGREHRHVVVGAPPLEAYLGTMMRFHDHETTVGECKARSARLFLDDPSFRPHHVFEPPNNVFIGLEAHKSNLSLRGPCVTDEPQARASFAAPQRH